MIRLPVLPPQADIDTYPIGIPVRFLRTHLGGEIRYTVWEWDDSFKYEYSSFAKLQLQISFCPLCKQMDMIQNYRIKEKMTPESLNRVFWCCKRRDEGEN